MAVWSKTHPAGSLWPYECTIRYSVPENDAGIPLCQRIDAEGLTRSKAREMAAEMAYRTVAHHGLWMNLRDTHMIPYLFL